MLGYPGGNNIDKVLSKFLQLIWLWFDFFFNTLELNKNMLLIFNVPVIILET